VVVEGAAVVEGGGDLLGKGEALAGQDAAQLRCGAGSDDRRGDARPQPGHERHEVARPVRRREARVSRAALIHKAIGKQLTCVFVDHGLMRKNEGEQVIAAFRDHFKVPLVAVDAEDRFLARLAGLSDPEAKRKYIGKTFIDIFEEEANKLPEKAGDAAGVLRDIGFGLVNSIFAGVSRLR
jgi:hypothetical protein